jgi:hypothetical protein
MTSFFINIFDGEYSWEGDICKTKKKTEDGDGY